MLKRLWLTGSVSLIVMAALAAVIAVSASAGTAKKTASSTLPLAVAVSDVDFSDPALAYGVLSWEIEYETCSKLINYPDAAGAAGGVLQPEDATAMPTISADGKTYTFTIKSGLKFSDGAAITAQDFAYAINRDANPSMQSPVVPFITDIVGLNAVVNKTASTVSGVVAKGNTLTIKLTQKDGGLLNKLAMPFFCAIEPAKTPVNPQGVTTLPGSGPYYIASRDIGKQLVLKLNPNYKGSRPHRSSTIVFTMNTASQQTYLEVANGTYAADPTGLDSPTAAAQLAQQYGINKSRFFVNALQETDYLALNTARPAFAAVAARKAANYAIDRPAVLRTRGFLPGKRTTQILPPALAGGFWGAKLYPEKGADPTTAKKLLGSQACGNVNLWGGTSPTNIAQEGIVSYNLKQMGCNVTLKQFAGFAIYVAAGNQGADFDIMFAGWNADYPDAYDFFHILLDGRTIHAANNNNLAYINDATLNKGIDAADALTGDARAKAFGKLDIYTMSKLAPWISIDNRAQRDFVGPNTAGYIFQPAYAAMDLGTLYLK
jgi:peptide/nickel transport system substrate-binding protein